MSITRYTVLVLCLLLTIPHQINCMDNDVARQLKNSAYIVGMATVFVGTVYGAVRLLEWLFPQQHSKNTKGYKQPRSNISGGNINARGPVTMSLRGTGPVDVSIGTIVSGDNVVIHTESDGGSQSISNITSKGSVTLSQISNGGSHYIRNITSAGDANPTISINTKGGGNAVIQTLTPCPSCFNNRSAKVLLLNQQQKIHAIEVQGIGQVLLYQLGEHGDLQVGSGEESVRMHAHENIIDQLQIVIVDDYKLVIGPKPNSTIVTHKEITYVVALKNIDQVSCTGSVKAFFRSPITHNELWLTLTDSATIKSHDDGKINVDLLRVTLRGAASALLHGKAETQQLYLSGSAQYDAQNVETNVLYTEASGANKIKVNMIGLWGRHGKDQGDISGELHGVTTLEYKGNPRINIQCTGASSYKQITQ